LPARWRRHFEIANSPYLGGGAVPAPLFATYIGVLRLLIGPIVARFLRDFSIARARDLTQVASLFRADLIRWCCCGRAVITGLLMCTARS